MKLAKPIIYLWVLIYSVFLGAMFLFGAEGKTPAIQPVGEEILTLSAGSERQVNFKGLRKFQRRFGERAYKAQVFHQAPDRWRLEFLEPEKRKGEVFILDGKRFWRSPQEKRRGFRHRGLGRRLETKDIERLVSNYKVEIQGEEEIAGRKVFVLKCTGKYPGRPSLIFWVDEENFLRLKEERLSPDGKITYRVEFEEIEFVEEIAPQLFEPPPGAKLQERRERREELSLAQAASQLDFDVLLPKSLPRGFELGRVRIVRRRGREQVLHLAYTDGLAQISLFEGASDLPRRRAGRTAPSSEESQISYKGRAVSLRERGHFEVLRLKEDRVSITLISEIPRQELLDMIISLEKFAPAIQPVGEEGGKKESGEHLSGKEVEK